jgi:outer membrane protein
MKKGLVGAALGCALMMGSLQAADMPVGIVNFRKVIDDSKLGKQELATFEQMRDQMAGSLEKGQKELQEMAAKLGDQEYMDGLSEQAQKELGGKFQERNSELMQTQNQCYQILNQAQTRMVQGIMEQAGSASKQVAKDNGLKMVIADEAVFYYAPELDVTKQVVAAMDAQFVPSAPATNMTLPGSTEAMQPAAAPTPAPTKTGKNGPSSCPPAKNGKKAQKP